MARGLLNEDDGFLLKPLNPLRVRGGALDSGTLGVEFDYEMPPWRGSVGRIVEWLAVRQKDRK